MAHQELHYLLELSLSVAEVEEITDTENREALLDAVAQKLRDSIGIRPPKLVG